MRRLRDRIQRSDEGTSLIELLVVMIIFTMIMAIITTAIVNMMRESRRQNGQSNDMSAARKVITLLDHSARYANAITAPGTGTDGNFYFEFQTGNTGQQQTCTQWRWVSAGGKLQWRTWQPPLTGTGTVTATNWSTAAIGISQVGSTPVFSISPTSSADAKEELTVTFTATSGAPSTSSNSQVTLTAINSTSDTAPTTATCTQVGRP
ncbi:MAG TPA: prepilin-type N-terminal cleavage/methylation domain-containing protein [Mycobacteriales bacterium]|nr:prepilin-type N-terminal cleavage/methylation domain-containing protein [Mycobacteriales bacterium]